MDITTFFLIARSALFSLIILFLITRLMGFRQMSQLNMFDYTVGITLGSIAGEMATALEGDALKPGLALVIYSLSYIIICKCKNKFHWFGKIIDGSPTLLYHHNHFIYQNIQRTQVDLWEFLIQCRNSGYFHLEEIHSAILEPNGKISFIPKANYDKSQIQEEYELVIIADGTLIEENLKQIPQTKKWISDHLLAHQISNLNQVYLATYHKVYGLQIYAKEVHSR